MNDFLFFYPTCKTIYEIVRHHVQPTAEPVCELCQQDLRLLTTGSGLHIGERALDLNGQDSVRCLLFPAARC